MMNFLSHVDRDSKYALQWNSTSGISRVSHRLWGQASRSVSAGYCADCASMWIHLVMQHDFSLVPAPSRRNSANTI